MIKYEKMPDITTAELKQYVGRKVRHDSMRTTPLLGTFVEKDNTVCIDWYAGLGEHDNNDLTEINPDRDEMVLGFIDVEVVEENNK